MALRNQLFSGSGAPHKALDLKAVLVFTTQYKKYLAKQSYLQKGLLKIA